MIGHNYTSNNRKLLHNLDSLVSFQKGKAKPVMFHIAPTNKCNMGCSHCCFEGRDKTQELDHIKLLESLDAMKKIGVKSIEWTGGGEPTLYKALPTLTNIAKKMDFNIGMCTNGLKYLPTMDYTNFSWVRVSLNILDTKINTEEWEENIEKMKEDTKVTACYVASNDCSLDKFHQVYAFAEHYKIPTRIAPDCIQDKQGIERLLEKLNGYEKTRGKSDYVFISDFNIDLGDRENNFCGIHAIKPFLFADGYVYSCPSSELAPENERKLQKKFRVCSMEDMSEYYSKDLEIKSHNCSYCKYTSQNNLLQDLVKEVEDDKFC